MSIPSIPHNVQDWNIVVIDNLIPILSIESETFDFKGKDFNKKNDELYNDICAMANTSGGHIVLGIGEDKATDGSLIRFVKDGFPRGEENKVNQRIAENMYNIEPTPSIETHLLVYEKGEKKFYPVIKIKSIDFQKPYFTKNRGQCYIRVGNSSRHASRTIILNLFSNYRQRKIEVQKFTSSS